MWCEKKSAHLYLYPANGICILSKEEKKKKVSIRFVVCSLFVLNLNFFSIIIQFEEPSNPQENVTGDKKKQIKQQLHQTDEKTREKKANFFLLSDKLLWVIWESEQNQTKKEEESLFEREKLDNWPENTDKFGKTENIKKETLMTEYFGFYPIMIFSQVLKQRQFPMKVFF